MLSIKSQLLVCATGALLLGSLTACTGEASSPQAQETRDQLPAEIIEQVEVAPDASRYAGEHDGVRYWTGENTSTGTPCAIAFDESNPSGWGEVCGKSGPVETSGDFGRLVFWPDGTPENADESGLVAVSDKILVSE